MAALAWHPLLWVPGIVASLRVSTWCTLPQALLDLLHPGLACPARIHAVITPSAKQYGDTAVAGVFVRTCLGGLGSACRGATPRS